MCSEPAIMGFHLYISLKYHRFEMCAKKMASVTIILFLLGLMCAQDAYYSSGTKFFHKCHLRSGKILFFPSYLILVFPSLRPLASPQPLCLWLSHVVVARNLVTSLGN